MSFNIDDIELLSEIEDEFDLGFKNLPVGTYHFQVVADSSKVDRDDKTNEPRLRLYHKVIASEDDKNINSGHSEFFRWYPREDTPEKELVDATRKSRGRLMNYGRSLVIGLAQHPEVEVDMVNDIMQTLRAIPTDVPMTEDSADMVEAQFNVLLTLLDGIDFYASITQRTNSEDEKAVKAGTKDADDVRVYTNLNPAKKWEEAALKVGDAIDVTNL